MAQIVRRLLGDDKTVRYDVRFRVDGVVRNKTFRLRGEADAYKRKVEGDELAGLIVDPRGGERAFGPYATAWIDTRLAKGRPLTPATRQGYKGLLRRHLNPALEKAALRKITPERVRVWHSDLIQSAGQDQAAKSYRLLRAILNTAVSDRLLTQNPCTVPGAGTENTPERPLLDSATVLDLADAIDAPKSDAGTRTVAPPGIVTEEMRRAAVGIAGAHVHDLRHHGATMAAQTGITTRELMVRIGHSSPRAALIYQHATEERDRLVADQLDTLIAPTERTLRAKVVKLPRDPRAMDAG
jgi:integrase